MFLMIFIPIHIFTYIHTCVHVYMHIYNVILYINPSKTKMRSNVETFPFQRERFKNIQGTTALGVAMAEVLLLQPNDTPALSRTAPARPSQCRWAVAASLRTTSQGQAEG